MSKLMQSNFKKGFTLIEILVVMVIIGILAVIGVGGFRSAQQKSRDAKRKADLKHIAEALEAYYNDEGQYPVTDDFIITNYSTPPNTQFVNPSVATTIYMVDVPQDPSSSQFYLYESTAGTDFIIYAILENSNDLDAQPAGYGNRICGGTTLCNYAISSSNTSP